MVSGLFRFVRLYSPSLPMVPSFSIPVIVDLAVTCMFCVWIVRVSGLLVIGWVLTMTGILRFVLSVVSVA